MKEENSVEPSSFSETLVEESENVHENELKHSTNNKHACQKR